MNEVYELINRFQKIADKTGRSKMSSFYVDFHFSAHFAEDDKVTIIVGGYDIGGWNRHHTVESTGKTLVDDLREIVESAEQETANDGWCPSCREYTEHDENGKCLGYWDWDAEVKCEGE